MTGQAPNYWIFQTIRWYLYWPKFLQVVFCYCCHTLAVQLSRGHLILLSPSSAGLGLSGFSFVLSGVFLAEEVEGTRRQRIGRYPPIVDVWTLLEAVLNMSLRSACFTLKFLNGKKKNFHCQIIGISRFLDIGLKEFCSVSIPPSQYELSCMWWTILQLKYSAVLLFLLSHFLLLLLLLMLLLLLLVIIIIIIIIIIITIIIITIIITTTTTIRNSNDLQCLNCGSLGEQNKVEFPFFCHLWAFFKLWYVQNDVF